MADADTFEPGKVDEGQHGWAPDVSDSGGGEARERVIEANKKAFEGRDTQPESRGNLPNPAEDAADVGESTSRRGEDIAKRESDAGREDLGTKGPSDRPVGTSSSEASTGVNPADPADPSMQDTQFGQQGR